MSRFTSRETGWPRLEAGTPLKIIKLQPDGAIGTEYVASVIDEEVPSPWLAVRALWTRRLVKLDGLSFVPGDDLVEYFSPEHWFNQFAVFAPDGVLRGWYANVTRPAGLDLTVSPATLYWHDLYVDIVALPDGRLTVRDEDELEAANLQSQDPVLYQSILSARDDLVRRCQQREFPFHHCSPGEAAS